MTYQKSILIALLTCLRRLSSDKRAILLLCLNVYLKYGIPNAIRTDNEIPFSAVRAFIGVK